ncbi:MAG: hypothetical protein E6Q97_00555 [Desulfurellales bacterium]|nr:MAG: hypothetical protein E6Q97_00555 [Desulfurellales bacterium]
MANILYTCCTTIQAALQNSVTLTSSDTEVRAIEDAAIVIRKLGLRERDYEVGHLSEAMPGILIIPGEAKSPPEAGTDQSDDITYQIDLVIINKDNWLREDGLATYIQWQQNIRQYFNGRISGWPNETEGIVYQCWAVSSGSVNDWRWVNQGEATLGVRLLLTSREPGGR